MGGQIGNHFNKIPLRLNCISQEDQSRAGWNRRQRLNLYLPSLSAPKRGHLLRRQVYSRRTSHWNAPVQKVDCANAEERSSLDTRMSVSGRVAEFVPPVFVELIEGGRLEAPAARLFLSAIFLLFFAVKKTITSRALRRPSYFNYIVPALKPTASWTAPFHNPDPSQTRTERRHRITHSTSPLLAPCNYTIGRQHLFLGSVNVWLLLKWMRLSEQAAAFHYKIF